MKTQNIARNIAILAVLIVLSIAGTATTIMGAPPEHAGNPHVIPPSVGVPQEFFVETHINDVEANYFSIGSPWWVEIDTFTVTPNTTNNTGDGTVFYGIKYNAVLKINETGLNKEILYRIRLDLPDGRTFYTMWSGVKSDTYETVELSERISNIVHDGRWATGDHDLGLIVDQPYYNVTAELAVTSNVMGTVYNQTVDTFYFAPMPVDIVIG